MTEVALSALVLGPIVTTYSLWQYLSGPEFYHYFGNILGIVRYTLPGVFVDNPRANFVNANLWTLPAEFYCYLVLAALMGLGVFFRRRLYNWTFVLGTVALLVLPLFWGLSPRADNTHYSVYYIVYLFFVGALFYLYSRVIPVRLDMFLISFTGYYFLTLVGGFDVLAGFLLVYCVVYLGACEFPIFDRIVGGNDYSYGMYLYGYPISQTIIFFLQPLFFWWPGVLRLTTVMILSVLCALVFAAFSWHAIEKPALALKRILIRRPQHARSETEPALRCGRSRDSHSSRRHLEGSPKEGRSDCADPRSRRADPTTVLPLGNACSELDRPEAMVGAPPDRLPTYRAGSNAIFQTEINIAATGHRFCSGKSQASAPGAVLHRDLRRCLSVVIR